MSIRRALAEVEKGSGVQFDPAVVQTFLGSPVEHLWEVIQDEFIETWDFSNFEEYGIKAVGALIR
jgi:response regulator RpfG family c-di-GMP phosphodiesterase